MQKIGFMLVLMLLLTACGANNQTANQHPAVTAVENYLRAKVAADKEALRGWLCAAMEADLDREALSFSGVEASIPQMTCTFDAVNSTVACDGAIEAVYNGESREIPLGVYRAVEEDDVWKWCGEAG